MDNFVVFIMTGISSNFLNTRSGPDPLHPRDFGSDSIGYKLEEVAGLLIGVLTLGVISYLLRVQGIFPKKE